MIRALLLILFLFCESVYSETVAPIHPLLLSNGNGSLMVKIESTVSEGVIAILYKPTKNHSFEIASKFELANCKMPRDGFLSDKGNLVTLDNWYAYGKGNNVISVYEYSGKLIKEYSLSDIYNSHELAQFVETSSSTQWRCIEIRPTVYSGNLLHIFDRIGGVIVLNMDSGEYRYKSETDLICPEFP